MDDRLAICVWGDYGTCIDERGDGRGVNLAAWVTVDDALTYIANGNVDVGEEGLVGGVMGTKAAYQVSEFGVDAITKDG